MSKYTTQVRFICEENAGLTESVGYNDVDTVIETALPKIFDFDFPIYDEAYRSTLEKKILLHYYTREIGYETVGRWKLALKTKLNEMMPYYNELYKSALLEMNPLYTHDMYRKKDNTTKNDDKTTNNQSHEYRVDDTPNNTTKRLYSDTPQGALTGVDEESYLSSAEKTINTGTNVTINSGETHGGTTNEGTRTDDYLEHVYGYGGYNPSKLLKDWRETFLNIDMMIINDLSKLFMGLW